MQQGTSAVMPGLVPGIHVFLRKTALNVDGRDKPGHDKTRALRLCLKPALEIDVEDRQFEDVGAAALLVLDEQHADELLAHIGLE